MGLRTKRSRGTVSSGIHPGSVLLSSEMSASAASGSVFCDGLGWHRKR